MGRPLWRPRFNKLPEESFEKSFNKIYTKQSKKYFLFDDKIINKGVYIAKELRKKKGEDFESLFEMRLKMWNTTVLKQRKGLGVDDAAI